MRRDPQTLAMNQKSIYEADTIRQAAIEGCLTGVRDVRRPFNVTESNSDFVGLDRNNKSIDVELKTVAFDKIHKRSLDTQVNDIGRNANDRLQSQSNILLICDVSSAPDFIRKAIASNITDLVQPDLLIRLVQSLVYRRLAMT